MTNTSPRPFTVVGNSVGGQCTTHCKTLQGAIRSSKKFAPIFTSILIECDGEIVKVIR